ASPASAAEPRGPAIVPPPVVIPAAPSVAPPKIEAATDALVAPTNSEAISGEIAEIHAAREDSHFSQNRREVGHPSHGDQSAGNQKVEIAARTGGSAPRGQEIIELPLELIDENPNQTRQTFDPEGLRELAESIKASGLAQPVVVRPGANGRYVLVLGERRCRASKLAGKTSVSAIVRQLGDEQAAEMTVVENLQRQDLNCLEQAQAFARMSREFNLTPEQIGKSVGASRQAVADYLRVLKLPKGVLELIGAGALGFSEARVLLEALPHTSPDTIEVMARSAADGGLTVRHLKLQVESLIHPELNAPELRPEKPVDPNVRDA